MPLKRNTNGHYQIKNSKQLKEALDLRTEIQAMLEEEAYLEMTREVTNLSRACAEFMTRRGIEEIDFTVGKDRKKFRAVAVQRFNSTWINTDEEIPLDDPDADVRSLRSVLSDEQWAMVSKRVVDEERLDEAVRSGKIPESVIRPCLYEKPQTPYVRVYSRE